MIKIKIITSIKYNKKRNNSKFIMKREIVIIIITIIIKIIIIIKINTQTRIKNFKIRKKINKYINQNNINSLNILLQKIKDKIIKNLLTKIKKNFL